MSTSLLYHGFGIRGYYYVNSNYTKGQILFRIKHDFWKLDFAKEKCSYTRSFERYAVDLCRILPISDVAKLLKVSWGLCRAQHRPHYADNQTRLSKAQ